MKKYCILPVLAITAAFAISCNHKSAPDKPVSVAGGIYNSNYSPYSCVYAFKPF